MKILLESNQICGALEPMGAAVGVMVICDRKPRHSGKHMLRTDTGRTDWWKEHTDTHAEAIGVAL